MERFINLTTYLASDNQRELGVIDIDTNVASAIADSLNFPSLPLHGEMKSKASAIAEIAESLSTFYNTKNVVINAKAFFIPTLVSALEHKGLIPYYTFAQRTMTVTDGAVTSKGYIHKALVKCSPEA